MTTSFHIAGFGRAVPDGILTNADLEQRMDTSDAWIRERTGISERRVGGTTVGLAAEAITAALKMAGDLPEPAAVIVATATPDRTMPSTASLLVDHFGWEAAAFDINAACTGFIHALVSGSAFLEVSRRPVIVVGVDRMTSIIEPNDRSTAILFGDGAGAAVLVPGDQGGILGWDAGSEPGTVDMLNCDRGGFLQMNGQAVFKTAVRAATESIQRALQAGNLTADQVSLLVPHQANRRITDALGARLGLPEERVVSTIATTGNSSAGTIPFALSTAYDAGLIANGDIVAMCGFGAGMTWGSVILRAHVV